MSKNDDDITQIDDDSPDAPAQLRAAYERQKAKAARADAIEKENALLKAKVDTTSPLGKLFLKGYEGPIDDPEAIRAAAAEVSATLVEGSATTTAGDGTPGAGDGTAAAATPPEPTGTEQRTALADGALPSDAAVEDPIRSSVERAKEVIEAGQTEAVGIGEFVAMRAHALHEGRLAPVEG